MAICFDLQYYAYYFNNTDKKSCTQEAYLIVLMHSVDDGYLKNFRLNNCFA